MCCAWCFAFIDKEQIERLKSKSVSYLTNSLYSDIDMPLVDDKTIRELEEIAYKYVYKFPCCPKGKCRKIEQELFQHTYLKYKKNHWDK